MPIKSLPRELDIPLTSGREGLSGALDLAEISWDAFVSRTSRGALACASAGGERSAVLGETLKASSRPVGVDHAVIVIAEV